MVAGEEALSDTIPCVAKAVTLISQTVPPKTTGHDDAGSTFGS